MTRCTYGGCARKVYARGLCRSHYLTARDLGYFVPRYQPTLFPLDPLFDLTGETIPGFMRFHRISGVRFAIWRTDGLTTFEADRCAVRLGTTPDRVYHDAWWAAAADEVLDESFDAPLVLERT